MSEVKMMSSIQFPNTQQPYQVTDSRIPNDPGAYKYMATDGSGNWVAEDRLAYEETVTPGEQVYYGRVSFGEEGGGYWVASPPSIGTISVPVDMLENGKNYYIHAECTYGLTGTFAGVGTATGVGSITAVLTDSFAMVSPSASMTFAPSFLT